MNLAQQAWEEAAVPRVLELLDQQRPKAGEPDLRGFEWHYLHRLCHAGPLLTLKHNYADHRVAFSPDGTHLVSTTTWGTISGTPYEPELTVWDGRPARNSSPSKVLVSRWPSARTANVWPRAAGIGITEANPVR